MAMKSEMVDELLYQALETERGGVSVYENAVRCAVNPELRQEWEKYLEQTRRHERILLGVFEAMGLDPAAQTAGRSVVRHIGESLVQAMEMARAAGSAPEAQAVAAECVVLAETKDHLNWELLGEVAGKLKGEKRRALLKAHDEVEQEEDTHLYHTRGWTRELWIEQLGLPAVLPPPEEEKKVKTEIGAARAKAQRRKML